MRPTSLVGIDTGDRISFFEMDIADLTGEQQVGIDLLSADLSGYELRKYNHSDILLEDPRCQKRSRHWHDEKTFEHCRCYQWDFHGHVWRRRW